MTFCMRGIIRLKQRKRKRKNEEEKNAMFQGMKVVMQFFSKWAGGERGRLRVEEGSGINAGTPAKAQAGCRLQG